MSIHTRVLFRYIYNTFQKQTDLRHNKLKKNPETEPEPGELRNLEPPSTSASALVVDPGIPKGAPRGTLEMSTGQPHKIL